MKPASAVILAVTLSIVSAALPAHAQTRRAEGNVEAGRSLALRACTGCHVVAPDQPFKPILSGPPRPPDFKEIANRPNIATGSLQRHLETLPAVPKDLRMANPLLSSQETRDVVAFILSLRDSGAAQPK